jgi:L-asparaginase
MTRVKELVVISTGGTIAMTPGEGGQGVVPNVSGTDLVSKLPPLPDPDINVVVENFRNKPAGHLTFDELWQIADLIHQRAKDRDDIGFIITMGTDVLEEAAYFMDLLVGDQAPVVLTGAMRSGNQLGYDGYANLYHALLTAASPAARHTGAVLVMNEEIHSAQEVQKVHSVNPAAFGSPGWGPLGLIVEDEVWIKRMNLVREIIPASPPFPRVELIRCTIAMDDFLVAAAYEKGVDGLVIEALGVGHVSVPVRDVLVKAVESGVPVLVTTRCTAGTALTKTYGFPGSESDLISKGVMVAKGLPGIKARLKLTLAMASGDDGQRLRRRFSFDRDCPKSEM